LGQGDVRDAGTVARAVRGVDAVFIWRGPMAPSFLLTSRLVLEGP